jgi:hypothetical protein
MSAGRSWTGGGALLLWVLAAVVAGASCRPDGGIGGVRGALGAPAQVRFDLVAVGESRELTVPLENVSAAQLRITRMASSLASVAVVDAAPITLAPGEKRDVTLRFTPAAEGEVSGQVTVETDSVDPDARVSQLAVSGAGVRSFVEVRPASLDYGAVEQDTAKVLQLTVSNPTRVEAGFSVGFEGEDADQFSSSEAGRQVRVPSGGAVQLPVAFRPQRLGLAQARARISRCATCEPVLVELTGEGVAAMLEVFPTTVDFGRVAVGARAEQRVTVRNNGTEPVDFNGASVVSGQGTFTSEPAPAVRVAAGASVEVAVAFQPPAASAFRGTLRLLVTSPRAPGGAVSLRLRGEGGNTCLAISPRTVDFGTVAVGMALTREVSALNRCPHRVTVTELSTSASQGGFFGVGQAGATLVVEPGQRVSIPVTFTAREGESRGELTVRVREGSSTGTEAVALKGTGRAFAPCSYTVAPATLDFRRVQVGASVTLTLALTNTGTSECFVGRMGLASGTDAAFGTDGFPGGALAPGARALLRVRFQPTAAGPSEGLVEGWVSNPSRPSFTVPVVGEGVAGCFTLEPATVDFGTVKRSCPSRSRAVVAINGCPAPTTLESALLEGAAAEFLLAGATTPRQLPGGGRASFDIGYAPSDEGEDAAALRVTTAEHGTFTVGVLAAAKDEPTRTDTFVQESQQKVDVLFVVDNSGSMMEEQESLGQNFSAFMSAAQAQGVDYHIGVTTTGVEASPGGWTVCPGGVDGGEGGRLFPADGSAPRVITPTTPNAAAVFSNNVKVGWCHWNEQGLEAAYRALSAPLVTANDDPRTPLASDGNAGFLRPDARLALVFVTDEEDFSHESTAFYTTFFKGLKGNNPDLLSISAIIGPENLGSCPTASSTGSRYLELARATGGAVESICTPDWSRSLVNLSNSVYGLKRSFKLSTEPADPSAITVVVDGAPVTAGWSYDAKSNSVVFTPEATPAAGAVIEVTYPLGC